MEIQLRLEKLSVSKNLNIKPNIRNKKFQLGIMYKTYALIGKFQKNLSLKSN